MTLVKDQIGWDVDTVRDPAGVVWQRNGDGTWRSSDGRHELTTSELTEAGPLTDLTDKVEWALGFGGGA